MTLAFALRGEHPCGAVAPYILVQVAGGIVGVWASHYMFDLPLLQTSETPHRTGSNQWFLEIIATLGLLFVIFGGIRHKPDTVPALVGLYITGTYWYTSSTSFANPAVTIARGFTDRFAGIYPAHIPMFIIMQIVAVFIGHVILNWLFKSEE